MHLCFLGGGHVFFKALVDFGGVVVWEIAEIVFELI